MTKRILMMMVLLMCCGVSVASAAVCNEKSSLQWTMNTEPDMDHYMVYHDSVTVVKGAATVQVFNVPHDPSSSVPGTGGEPTVVEKFPQLPEGPRFFRVSSMDNAVPPNESGLSNEVNCDVNMSPATPTLILQFG